TPSGERGRIPVPAMRPKLVPSLKANVQRARQRAEFGDGEFFGARRRRDAGGFEQRLRRDAERAQAGAQHLAALPERRGRDAFEMLYGRFARIVRGASGRAAGSSASASPSTNASRPG